MSALTAIISFLFLCFIILGIIFHGILPSYSAYSRKWGELLGYPIWSIMTFFTGMLLIPALLEIGENNALQFMGFLTPIYLIGVSLTPDWQLNESQYKTHMTLAILCAICAILWIIFVSHTIEILILCFILNLIVGLFTRTLKNSIVLYGELIAFESMFISMIISL